MLEFHRMKGFSEQQFNVNVLDVDYWNHFRFIGFSTDKGTVGVYLLDFEAQEPIVITSQCDETQKITFIEWKNTDHHMFIGNKKGIVSIVFIDMLFVRLMSSRWRFVFC